MSEKTLHLSRWIVPVSTPPVHDGALLVEKGFIKAIGKRKEVLTSLKGTDIKIFDHKESVILPGLINCHTHIELSWLKGAIPKGLGFSKWLKRLMSLKAETDNLKREKDALSAIKRAEDEGTCVFGDVGNDFSFKKTFSKVIPDGPFFHFFLEIIHPDNGPLELDETIFSSLSPFMASFSAHSVYTCSRDAIRMIKNTCKSKGLPFSIHVSESMEEMEFVKERKGHIYEILKERGRDVRGFFSTEKTPVRLLKKIGVLDKGTICVHGVFLDEKDIEILRENEANLCLCPRSNEYISGILPRAKRIFLKLERVCLGTDSLSSNSDLSILAEINFLYNRFSDIDPKRLIAAATINGARALGISKRYGSLEPGKRASFFVLGPFIGDEKELFDFICSYTEPERIKAFVR